MPSQDSIDVRIMVDGQPSTEYCDPQTDLDDVNLRTRYIEAKTGQNFGFRIKFLQGFELRSAKYTAAEFQIDNNTIRMLRGGTSGMPRLCDAGGALSTDYVWTTNCNSQSAWNEGLGEWTTVNWTFGALGYNERNPETCKLPASEIAKLGCVHIIVYRARRQDREKPFYELKESIKTLDELPEATLKGSGVKNNTKYMTAGKIPAPPPRHHDHVPLDGKDGQGYEFKFLYRAKQTLQNLGCIPRSPSPPPDTRLMLERTEYTLKQEKLESARLRARVASLEAGSREGSDAFTADIPSSFVKQENATVAPRFPSVKRKREDVEDDDEIAEMAPPPKKPTVTIDLTDD